MVGGEWGCSPIYLRFDPNEAVNAARELRDLELVWRVSGEAGRSPVPQRFASTRLVRVPCIPLACCHGL